MFDVDIEYDGLDIDAKISPILKEQFTYFYEQGREDMALNIWRSLKTLKVNLVNVELTDREIVEFAISMVDMLESKCDNAVEKF